MSRSRAKGTKSTSKAVAANPSDIRPPQPERFYTAKTPSGHFKQSVNAIFSLPLVVIHFLNLPIAGVPIGLTIDSIIGNTNAGKWN